MSNILEFDILDDDVVHEPTSEAHQKVLVKRESVESLIGQHVNSALSLDISLRSTGVALWRDGKLVTGVSQSSVNAKQTSIYVGIRMKEIENDILELVGERTHFDLICIEEALLGINARTSAPAYALNFVIDTLLAKGLLTCDKFVRFNNGSWKSELRGLTGTTLVKQGKNSDKKEVIEGFKRLGYPLASRVDSFKSWTAYMKSGVQDQLDAVGVMLGAVQRYYYRSEPLLLDKKISCNVFSDLTSAYAYAKHEVEAVEPVGARALNPWYKNLSKRILDSTSLLMPVTNLGRFGIVHNLFLEGSGYLVVNIDYVKEGKIDYASPTKE